MSGAMGYDLELPIRDPDVSSPPLMTKRARWLVVLGFLLPGSAQLLAGNRRLGRFGLMVTVATWIVLIAVLAGLLFARVATLSILTHPWVLFVLQWLMLAIAVIWVVLGFDTLRLTKLVRVQSNWRFPVAMLSVVLTVLPVLGVAYAASVVGTGRATLGDLFQGGPSVAPVDGRYNILLLGTDAGSDREGMRPDSISLVSVDAKTGQSAIIGLPRELVDMPFPESSPMHEIHPNGFCVGPNQWGEWGGCYTTGYLNAVYTEVEDFPDVYGGLYPDAVSRGSSPGIEATKDAVEGATGLEVQFYVLINMDGFSNLIDALGGVEIDVQERLPIGGSLDPVTNELVNVTGWIEPGKRKLNGYEAQWYARSRYGSVNGDYDRMARQRELQAAILAQIKPDVVLLRFEEIMQAGTHLVETDLPNSMLGRFLDLATKSREHTPVNVELVPPQVDAENPDYAVVRELVDAGIAEASPPQEE